MGTRFIWWFWLVWMIWWSAATVQGQEGCFAGPSWDWWPGCVGDIDADGDVDEADLRFVVDRIGTAEIAADIDLDGLVTQADADAVAASIGEACQWPPDRHAVLRFVTDATGADIWLDLPPDITGGTYGVAGIQAWLVTTPDRSGTVELDPATVWVDLCGGLGGPLYDAGRIGFAWGAEPGHAWAGSVHLGRLHGPVGDYLLLYRPAGPPARCAEILPDGGVQGLRFIVTVQPRDAGHKQGVRGILPR